MMTAIPPKMINFLLLIYELLEKIEYRIQNKYHESTK
jgi:hypothetical protein